MSATFPAATVLVVRTSRAPASRDGDIEVLLVRRSHRASFMANAFVFPGGRVDAADEGPALSGGDSGSGSWAAPQAADPLLALRRAAARELAEEVSLQVGDLAQLIPFAHWITPSAEPKRFDTAFFLWPLGLPDATGRDLAARPAPPEVTVDGREVFDPLWITPAAALARYAEGTLNLPPPTVCTIEDLAAEVAATRAAAADSPPGPRAGFLSGDHSLLQALITRCAVRRPLPVLPKFFAAADGGLSIVMPWDAQYIELTGEGEPVPALATGATPVPHRIRRCQLKPLNPSPAPPTPNPVANYAAATASAQGAAAPTRATDLHIVPWTVERAES